MIECPVEMLKNGDGVVASLLYLIFNMCWRYGRVPDDWCKAVIVPLYKGKGSQQECKNYRGISLLSVVGKLYAKVLINRVIGVTDEKIWDVQAGFREGNGLYGSDLLLKVHSRKTSGKAQESLLCFRRLGEGLRQCVEGRTVVDSIHVWCGRAPDTSAEIFIQGFQCLC